MVAATAAGTFDASMAGEGKRATVVTCSGSEVKPVVRRLIRAFNDGNAKTVDNLVAKEPRFKWLAVGGPDRRLGTAATVRSTLTQYVLKRHRQNDRLRLIRLRFQGATMRNTIGHFNLLLVRQARDYAPRTVPGKGAVVCNLDSRLLIVWALGGAPPRRR